MSGGSEGLGLYAMWERFRWVVGFTPTKGDKPAKGRYGEWIGEKFLRKRGFSVIRRNWRSSLDRRLEIDLVCMDSEVLVFVEIRARSKGSLVDGYASLSRKKRNALKRSIRSYLIEESRKTDNYRLDLVEIDLPIEARAKPQVFHHENIAISF